MKKQTASLKALRKAIAEALENDDLNSIEVGDVVEVDLDEIGILPVRVIELFDDVNAVAGGEAPRNPGEFSGPGFLGEIDPESGESGRMVFSLNQVLPGSKAKGYFPRDVDDVDLDARPDVDEGDKVDGYVANTDGDPHKEDHADPTGRNWGASLDELDESNYSSFGGINEDITEEVGETFYRLLMKHFSAEHLKRGTLEILRRNVEECVSEQVDKLTGITSWRR